MMAIFVPAVEHVTAVMTTHLETGENFDGAITLGYYPGNRAEVFIQTQGQTVNIQVPDVNAFCRELKRAKKMAIEQEQTE